MSIQLGALLYSSEEVSDYPKPHFVWGIITNEHTEPLYIINSLKGKSAPEIQSQHSDTKLVLPNHCKFVTLRESEIRDHFQEAHDETYVTICKIIPVTNQYENNLTKPLINMAYVMMNVFENGNFIKSKKCKNIIENIENSPYSLVRKTLETETTMERKRQYAYNAHSHLKLEFLPKKFALLKIIADLKPVAQSNFPATDTFSPNLLFQDLFMGMIMLYIKANRDNIRGATINYAKDFQGEFKTFSRFVTITEKYENEMSWYKLVKEFDDQFTSETDKMNVNRPQTEHKMGVIFKFIEFDLAFWQKLILYDIIKDVPVAKPYKDGVSESYNYMLLLPFFQWLAPHIFPSKGARSYEDEDYQRVMITKMKSVINGGTSIE